MQPVALTGEGVAVNMPEAKKIRPELAPEADRKSLAGDTLSLPDAVDMLNGVHVVMVAHKVAGEVRYRRRFFLSLHAAQRAVDKAVERGQAASITLCKLAPVRGLGWDGAA
ncbi:hypothetical protein SAMN04487966_102294 [Micrococcus terreus]|uniref:Uncharacterized protein n=1 Tax=Micrococcus terreus TaxID=574650 RepID=A0A1I7MHD3_9MICC|nr:hypothetical protein SAMN04487966_102294 [Micrococcus terreus]